MEVSSVHESLHNVTLDDVVELGSFGHLQGSTAATAYKAIVDVVSLVLNGVQALQVMPEVLHGIIGRCENGDVLIQIFV